MEEETGNFYTFTMNRKCKHCNEPIADQEHALRKFCSKKILPNGRSKNCKDRHNNANRKNENSKYNDLAKFHKKTDRSIAELMKSKGDTVTRDDLDYFKIDLRFPVEGRRTSKGQIKYYFICYIITQINTNQFKLTEK